jgi:hypothetical protein
VTSHAVARRRGTLRAMPELTIARTADGRHALRVPVDGGSLLFTTDADWPRERRLRCDPLAAWPDDAEVVDEVAVVEAARRGPSLDLVLDRGARHRCRFVVGPDELDDRGSRVDGASDVVWWQTGASSRTTPPRQRVPTARERGVDRLEIVVDSREQRRFDFDDVRDCELVVATGKLAAGDYGVRDGDTLVAAVERKKLSDFTSSLTSGRLSEQLAVLATLPRAAVVVEVSYSRVLSSKRVARGRMADLVAAVQASFPTVPVVFAGTRPAAAEWTWRYLAAAWSHHLDERGCRLLDPH